MEHRGDTLKTTLVVFVSSAMQELEYEREATEDALKELRLAPWLFELLPAMNVSPSTPYLEAVRECDLFVMIVGQSLRQAVLREYEEAVRTAKPILVFAKSLNEGEKRDDELDLFLTRVLRSKVISHYRKLGELKKGIQSAVMQEVAHRFQGPVVSRSRRDMYELGSFTVRAAERRLYVFQQTPSLLLGARPYAAPPAEKVTYEVEFTKTVHDWIDAHVGEADARFLYLFSASETKRELRRWKLLQQPASQDRLCTCLEQLREIRRSTSGRFRFGVIKEPFSGPMIVGDDRYAIWIHGGEDAVSVSRVDAKMCDTLVGLLESRCAAEVVDGDFGRRLDLATE